MIGVARELDALGRTVRVRRVPFPGDLLLACLTGLSLGVAVSVHPALVTAVLAIGAFGVISWVRPKFAIGVGLALTALPYAWSPTIFSITVAPALVVTSVWIGVSLLQGGRTFHLHRMDLAVAAFVVAPALSAYIVSYPYTQFWYTIGTVAIPYMGARLFLSSDSLDLTDVLPAVLVGVGCAVSLLAFFEVATGNNPATSILTNPDLSQWTEQISRAGVVRAQATFGHPIALGAFLLMPIGFAAAWPRRRLWWALPILLTALLLTFSRGPWIGLVVMLGVIFLTEASINRRYRGIGGLILLVGALAWLVGPVHEVIQASFSPGTVEAGNASYRSQLIETAFHHLTLAGTPVSQSETAELVPGLQDLTSTLALTILRTGILGLAALVALTYCVVESVIRAARWGDARLRAIGVVLIGQLIVLLTVALITNYQYVFWMCVALLGAYETVGRRQSSAAGRGDDPRSTSNAP
jgi:hypothetical protein